MVPTPIISKVDTIKNKNINAKNMQKFSFKEKQVVFKHYKILRIYN